MQPNWFIAWPVVVDAAFQMPEPPAAVRIFHPDDRHVTAAFLGACSEAAAVAAFETARHVKGPITAGTFGATKPLGKPTRPSAFSALVDEGHDALEAVMAAHRDDWLAAVGRGSDPYDPLPHCTLARPLRRATDSERRTAIAWAERLPTAGVRFEVRPLALYTWAEDRREQLFRIWA